MNSAGETVRIETQPVDTGGWIVDRHLRIWLIILMVGGGLMFLSFFVPWWRVSQDLAEIKAEDLEDVRSAKDDDWYDDHGIDLDEDDETDSAWLFGWSSGTGIAAFIFSFFIIAWGIVPWFVRLLQPWAWIGCFVCMLFGLITFILSLVWYFSSPGEDVAGHLAQGVILGPYLLIPAALAVFVGGLLGGIFGLLAFLKNFQKPDAA